MPELPSYAKRLYTRAHRDATRFIQHKLLTGASVAIAAVIVRLALWHFHRLTSTWVEVWITLLTIAGSYGIVVAGAFVVNLFRAPGLLDKERADEIGVLTDTVKQRTDENAVLAEKLKTPDLLNKQKALRITFAKLMEEGRALEDRMRMSQSSVELNAVGSQFTDWVTRTAGAFNEADMHTDASAFVHSGERPSPEQVNAAPTHLQPWKQYPMAQLTIYVAKLQEIVERKNL
jgi:hypothetical protein